MGDWNALLKLLHDLTAVLEELTAVEQHKTQSVIQGERNEVEQCMKKEQILSLKLRGFDKKRAALLDSLHLSGVPLRDIMNHCPQGREQETKEAAQALRRQYSIFQAASEVAKNTLECNLHVIEKILEENNVPVPSKNPAPGGSTNFIA